MEIFLQGHSTYKNLNGWKGNVTIRPLNLYQFKTISASKNTYSLFKKFLKMMKGNHSPVDLPDKILPEKLDIADFVQILVGISASTKHGRGLQKTYTCKKCKTQNPRVIDIIKVFIPKKPIIAGGLVEADANYGDKKRKSKTDKEDDNKSKEKIICRNVTLQDFLETNTLAESLTIEKIKEDYGDIVIDDEDIEGFKETFSELCPVAMVVTVPGYDTIVQKIKWLLLLEGGKGIDIYNDINKLITNLSPSMNTIYTTQCTKCQVEIKDDLSPTNYFLGTR